MSEVNENEEVVEEVAEEVVEEVEETDPLTGFDSLLDSLGDADPETMLDVLKRISPDMMDQLSPDAKVIIRQTRNRQKQRETEYELKRTKDQTDWDEERKKFQDERDNFLRQKAQFGQMFSNPEFQKKITDAEALELPENADLTDPANIKIQLQKMNAEGLKDFSTPFQKMAEESAKEASYRDFQQAHPRTNEPKFKKRMLTIKAEREASGNPVGSREDLYAIAELDEMKEIQVSQKRDRDREHARSAAKVNKRSNSSTAQKKGIPDFVNNVGYKGEKGNTARYLWLQDNPDVAKEIRAAYANR